MTVFQSFKYIRKAHIAVWLTVFLLGKATLALAATEEHSNFSKLGKEFDFKLFKFPSHLAEAMNEDCPTILCFSNFSWNLELGYKFASLAKQKDPNIVTVFGGPNFPTLKEEKLNFLNIPIQ